MFKGALYVRLGKFKVSLDLIYYCYLQLILGTNDYRCVHLFGLFGIRNDMVVVNELAECFPTCTAQTSRSCLFVKSSTAKRKLTLCLICNNKILPFQTVSQPHEVKSNTKY